jgi:hypothetical protein
VIVHPVERLTRRPVELEEFVAAVDAAKVRHVRFVVEEMDLCPGDGLMVARMLGAMAAHESATKSRRVQRKTTQNAEQGLPNGGPRQFGFDSDWRTIRPDEAAVIKTVVARYLAGESMRSLTSWLNAAAVPTVRGKEWRTPTVRAPSCPADGSRGCASITASWSARPNGADHHRGPTPASPSTNGGASRLRTPHSASLPAQRAPTLRTMRGRLFSAPRETTRR